MKRKRGCFSKKHNLKYIKQKSDDWRHAAYSMYFINWQAGGKMAFPDKLAMRKHERYYSLWCKHTGLPNLVYSE